MYSEATYKLLGRLYQIVPLRESQTQIAKEAFINDKEISVNDILQELLSDAYIYQSTNDSGDKTGQYGMTLKGINFYDQFIHGAKPPAKTIVQAEPPVKKEIEPLSASVEIPEDQEQKFTLGRAIPAILLIVFAFAIIWFITHIKR